MLIQHTYMILLHQASLQYFTCINSYSFLILEEEGIIIIIMLILILQWVKLRYKVFKKFRLGHIGSTQYI